MESCDLPAGEVCNLFLSNAGADEKPYGPQVVSLGRRLEVVGDVLVGELVGDVVDG